MSKFKLPKEIIPYLKSVGDIVNKNSIQSYGTIVRIICKGETLTIVSTDGYRLKEFKLNFAGQDFGDVSFNLSKAEIGMLAKSKTDFEFRDESGHSILEFDKTVLALSHCQIKFPDYKAILPVVTNPPVAAINFEYLGEFFPSFKGKQSCARMYSVNDQILFMQDFEHGKGLYLVCSMKEEIDK